MKRIKFVPILLALFLCMAACAGEQPSPGASSEAGEPAGIPALEFEAPENPHWILGESAYGDGYLAVYEEEFPDEYNKRFSSDTVFHAIRWQLFDAGGRKTGEGDSGWSNAFALHDLPVSGFQAQDGLAVFSVRMPAEYSQWPFRRKFTLVIDDGKLPVLGENPNGYRYRLEDWYPLDETQGCRLEHCSDYDWTTDRSVNRLLLTDPSGGRRETVFDCDDRDFWYELMLLNQPGYTGYEGEEPAVSQMRIESDPERGIVVFTIPKLTATVDFNTGETRVERHYTAGMLQSKIAQSPDGRYCVYTAGEFGRFESAGGCDYVSAGPDGEISFLYAGSDLDQLAFAGNGRVIANTFDRLACYDAATGLPLDRQVPFDYGEVVMDEGNVVVKRPKYLTVGLAVDQKNERILVAYRLNTFGNWELEADGKTLDSFPVTLAVFDFSGTPLTEVETGLSVKAFTKYTLIPVEILTDHMGNATLRTDDPGWGGEAAVPYPIG